MEHRVINIAGMHIKSEDMATSFDDLEGSSFDELTGFVAMFQPI